MGGFDIILFTGGIGENQLECRLVVCEGLEFMGVELDKELNAKIRGIKTVISTLASKVKVLLLQTDEELLIASDTVDLLKK